MRLCSIEIQGFKSFPDKTTMHFGGGITAVVGPNGSGKSNIADAVRWVLGEQSSKTLRGGKMEDVIFGGTQTRGPVGYASVALTIDNAEGSLSGQAERVTISRRLYRSGESEYRLNGASVRLRDIHELLMDTGLGRDGYSIIGQGRIAEIVSSKPRERREIFEEAAGISKYRFRKEEAEKKLLQAEENLLRLRDILAELESRVGPLQEQAEKAKEFLLLSEEKKQLEISLWMLSLKLLKGQMAEQEDKVYLCKNNYEAMEREGEALEEEISAAYERAQTISRRAEELRAQVRALEEQIAAGASEIAVLQNDIRHNELAIARAEQEMHNAGLGAEELHKQVEEKRRALAEYENELSLLDGKLEAAEQHLAEQREQAARVQQEADELSVRGASLREAAEQARLARATSESLRGESAARLGILQRNSGEHDRAAEEIRSAMEECGRQLLEEQEKAASLINERKGYALKREARAEKLKSLLEKTDKLAVDTAAKRQRAKLLEDMEAGMEGFAGSVKHILGEAKKGALGSVYGPVSSLLGVDTKYALAIETALGASVQHIVVKDEAVAKEAIRLLKTAGAGRATFLPLTSVRGKAMDTKNIAGDDGFIGTAASLVRFEPRFEGVMNQLLGRVAVVEDLDAGTRIAKANGYSFRIVTLDGQLINTGGSFTGGSSAKGAGVLGRRIEIERLRADAKALEEQIAAYGPERKALEAEIAGLDAYLEGAAAEQRTCEEEQMRLGFLQERLGRELEQALRNGELAAQELEQLQARLKELEGSGLSAERLLEELNSQLAELDTRLAAVRARQETLAVGTASLTEALAAQRMEALAVRKDQELRGQELQQLLEQAESAGTRAQQLTLEKEDLQRQNAEITQKIAEIEQYALALREQTQAGNDEANALRAQRTGIEADITALRQKEKEAAGRREGVSRELAKLEERQHGLQADCDGIITKLWDEYEMTRSQAEAVVVDIPQPDKASRRLNELRGKIRALGSVNVAAIEEYREVSGRYEFLSAQLADVEASRAQLAELIGDLAGEMRLIFTENFTKIAERFSRVFVQLFGGGAARLALSGEEDVLESGVEIIVQPPGKLIKNLSLLSGGEQAFVAIAIYFAILKVRPAPFCLLDEIESALDDVNVVKFASYLRSMSQKTQFIAITHRRGTMEEADVLYGVTMQDEGVSKLLELSVHEVEAKLGMQREGAVV